MQITIIAVGSRGDVQPYVALGTGLRERGHGVRIVTSDDFQSLVTEHQLGFVSTGVSSQAVAVQMQSFLEKGDMLKILGLMRKVSARQAIRATEAGLSASEDADLIIAGLGGLFSGVSIAEKLNRPFLSAYLVPFHPTREFPSVLTPFPQTFLTTWFNKPSHFIAQQTMWQPFRAGDTLARTQVLHMQPASFWGPFSTLNKTHQTTLYAYSEQVIPRPNSWGAEHQVTGYWFLEPSITWTPPDELLRFLQKGPAPIYIGFGSMTTRKPEESADLVLQALECTGQRGIVYTGWGGLKKEQVPSHVYMIDTLPHNWLFPKMAAVVHHGGVGTTAAGLAAGVPSIIVPFFGDQPFWGQRIHQLGVGPQSIPHKKLTADKLTHAIEVVLATTEIRTRAAVLGERIRAENGVARAVEIIEQTQ